MMRLLALLLLLGAALVRSDEQLKVVFPDDLRGQFPNGTIFERPALFGFPNFAAEITGQVVYATPGDLDGCDPLNRTSTWPSKGSVIVMIDRGDCSFTRKVSNAEAIGANAVVVVDNFTDPFHPLPYMADDGNGKDIEIPSMIIRNADGAKIKAAMAAGPVVLSMSWGIPHPDERVEWVLWTSSGDFSQTMLDFRVNFASVALALNNTAFLQPRFFVLYRSFTGDKCTNNNTFCAEDPNGPGMRPTGADVVTENLRQICLWRYLNQTDRTVDWWRYVLAFQSRCPNVSSETDFTSCHMYALSVVGVSHSIIQACIDESGGLDGPNNSILLDEYIDRVSNGIYFNPSIFINDVRYLGSLKCPSPVYLAHCGVLQALCAGFADTNQPDACAPSDCPIMQKVDDCGKCGGNNECKIVETIDEGGLKTSTVVGIVIASILVAAVLFGAVAVWYIRRERAQMRTDIDSILSQYMPLDEEGKRGGNRGLLGPKNTEVHTMSDETEGDEQH